MNWQDYQHIKWQTHISKSTELDVECPNCGAKIHRQDDVVLTSYPPQYRYECKKCGWSTTGL